LSLAANLEISLTSVDPDPPLPPAENSFPSIRSLIDFSKSILEG